MIGWLKESGEARLVFVVLIGASAAVSALLGWVLIRFGDTLGPLLSALRMVP